MKRIFAIIVLICLLVGVSLAEEFSLQDAVKTINSYSSSVSDLIETTDDITSSEIEDKVDALEKFWKEEEKKLCYFTNYDKIKGLGESLAKLKTAVKNNDKSLAVENVASIQSYAYYMRYIMGFNINNLF
jgi:uncharacterized protein YoxC